MKGLLIWIFPLQINFVQFRHCRDNKGVTICGTSATVLLWVTMRLESPASLCHWTLSSGQIKVPPIINPASSTKNAMECRSRNLITLVCSFYHSLSNYAWFDFLSLKLTQSRALVEQEYHVRPSLPSAFRDLYILGDPGADSRGGKIWHEEK